MNIFFMGLYGVSLLRTKYRIYQLRLPAVSLLFEQKKIKNCRSYGIPLVQQEFKKKKCFPPNIQHRRWFQKKQYGFRACYSETKFWEKKGATASNDRKQSISNVFLDHFKLFCTIDCCFRP
jgi:hypothetical protein